MGKFWRMYWLLCLVQIRNKRRLELFEKDKNMTKLKLSCFSLIIFIFQEAAEIVMNQLKKIIIRLLL